MPKKLDGATQRIQKNDERYQRTEPVYIPEGEFTTPQDGGAKDSSKMSSDAGDNSSTQANNSSADNGK